ncbi:MAG TPA: tetratricopeptide repeat protein [bacterium]|nr:tetratricopeptide repeat protein [bacterium]
MPRNAEDAEEGRIRELRRELLAQASLPAGRCNLAYAALLIAAEAYPGLDIPAYLARLDGLAGEAADRLRGLSDLSGRLQALSAYLYEERGFAGNSDAYYDPRNSYLNEVLDRGLGIPISLAVICLHVARRAQLPLVGVGFPGHFLVKTEGPEELLLDPFNGNLVSRAACEEWLRAAQEPLAELGPRWLAPATPVEMLVRMLRNLLLIYSRGGPAEMALACAHRILLLAPDSAAEWVQRAGLYEQLGRPEEASADLEQALRLGGRQPWTGPVRAHLQELQRRLKPLN